MRSAQLLTQRFQTLLHAGSIKLMSCKETEDYEEVFDTVTVKSGQ